MAGVYKFNPACECAWCQNDGNVPDGTASNGHSFGYDKPHVPPVSIIGLLSWYDEHPAWLERAILSLHKIPGLDHLIALDGAYALYPDGTARSGLEQYEAIHNAAAQNGIGLTIHTPTSVWRGNEIEKRTFLFRLADQIAQSKRDWLFVFDGDEEIKHVPTDLAQRLAGTSTFDVADVTLNEPHPTGRRTEFRLPMFFRASLGLTVVGNHFTYRTPDGRNLWGNARTDRLEPRIDLTDMRVDHYTHFRPTDRNTAAKAYYTARDLAQIEDPVPCVRCGQPAKHEVPDPDTLHRQDVDGVLGYAHDAAYACPVHATEMRAAANAQIRDLGLQPA